MGRMKKLITIIIVIAFAVNSAGQGYALRPMTTGNSNKSLLLAYKKCLVLDCDGVLWGGIIGEDGIEGIQLTQAYIEFQKKIRYETEAKKLRIVQEQRLN